MEVLNREVPLYSFLLAACLVPVRVIEYMYMYVSKVIYFLLSSLLLFCVTELVILFPVDFIVDRGHTCTYMFILVILVACSGVFVYSQASWKECSFRHNNARASGGCVHTLGTCVITVNGV